MLNILAGKISRNQVRIAAQRFLETFQGHGIEPVQIPRLMPAVPLAALKSEENLLEVLTPEVLDQTAQLFGIRSQWLEGIDDRIYEYLACNKDPKILLENLARLLDGEDVGLTFPLRILATTKQLDRQDSCCGYMAPILVEKIADLGEERIYRYHIYQDGYDWSHSSARIELKCIVRIVLERLHTPVPLFVVSNNEMENILEGRMIPRRFLHGCLLTRPSLEDYVMNRDESPHAKEVDELPEVLSHIDSLGLQDLSFGAVRPEGSGNDGSVQLGPINYDPPQPPASRQVPRSASKDWHEKARLIAEQLDAIDARSGAHDSKTNLAERVAVELRKRKISGPHGPLSGATVLREALGGQKWKRNR